MGTTALAISIDPSGVVTGQKVAAASLQGLRTATLSAVQGLQLIAASNANIAASTTTMSASLSRTVAVMQEETRQLQGRVAAVQAGTAAEANFSAQLAIRNALINSGAASLQVGTDQLIVNSNAAVAAITAETIAQSGLNAQLLAMGPATEVATAGLSNMNSIASRMLIRAALLAIVVALADVVKNSLDAATAFESSMTRLQTLVGISAQEANSYRAAMIAISLETGQTADENAKAMFAITSAGLRGQAALDALKASAEGAAIGLGDQTTVARAAVSASVAYGAATLTASEAQDVMIGTAREGNVEIDEIAGSMGRVTPVAAAVGVSFAQVGAAIATMTRMGVSANESVTGLRGLLSALDIKSAKTAEPALESVGLTLQKLRQEIQDKGLAAALLDLVSKFDGNTESLSKIIPNIRALTEALGTGKSQAADYAQILENITSGIGSATAAAFELQKTDPAFVFKLMTAAINEAERSIGAQLLPRLVELATDIRNAISSGDLSGWATVLKGALEIVISAGEAVNAVLINVPAILASIAAWSITSGAALTAAGTALGYVEAQSEKLIIAVGSNPLGAIAVAALVLISALSAYGKQLEIEADLTEKSISQENLQAISVAALAADFDKLTAAKKRAAAPFAATPTLGTNDDQFLGKMIQINAEYDHQVVVAGNDKVAIEAANIARERELSLLLAEENQKIASAKAAEVEMKATLSNTQSKLANANATLEQLKADAMAAKSGGTSASEFAGLEAGASSGTAADTAEAYKEAKDSAMQFENEIKNLNNQIAANASGMKVAQEFLDQYNARNKVAAQGIQETNKAAINFHATLQEQIAVRNQEAQAALTEAQAWNGGTAAVREAEIVAQGQKLLIEDLLRAKKDHTVVTDAETKAILRSVQQLAESNSILSQAKSLYASDQAAEASYIANKGKLTDAINGNTFASSAANEQEKTRQLLIKLGLDDDSKLTEDKKITRDAILENTQNTIDDAAATMRNIASIKDAQSETESYEKSLAELTDAQNRNKTASQSLVIEQNAIKAAISQGLDVMSPAFAMYVAMRVQKDLDTASLKANTVAQVENNKNTFDESLAAAEISDLKVKIGLQGQMPEKVGNIVVKYAAYKTAVEAVTVANEINTRVESAGIAANVDDITKEVEAHHKLLDSYSNEKAVLLANQEAAKEASTAILDQFANAGRTLETGLTDALTKVQVNWHDIIAKMLRDFLNGIVEMQAKAQGANLANSLFGTSDGSNSNSSSNGILSSFSGAIKELFGAAQAHKDAAAAIDTSTIAQVYNSDAITAVQTDTANNTAGVWGVASKLQTTYMAQSAGLLNGSSAALNVSATALDSAAAAGEASSAGSGLATTAEAGGIAGGFSSFLGAIAVFAVAVGLMMAYVSKEDAAIAASTYGTQGDISIGQRKPFGQQPSIGSAQADVNNLTSLGQQFTSAIQTFLENFEKTTGSLITNLPNISVLLSQDGKSYAVTVSGVVLGFFKDLTSATNAAINAALKNATFSGLDQGIADYLKKALTNNPNIDPDILKTNVGTLQDIINSAAAVIAGAGSDIDDALQKIIDTANSERDAVIQMGITGQDLIKFLGDISAAEVDGFQQERDTLTGKKETNDQIKKEEADAFNAKLTIARAQVQLDIDSDKEALKNLEAQGDYVRGVGGITVGMSSIALGVVHIAGAIVKAAQDLTPAEQDLTNTINDLTNLENDLNNIQFLKPSEIVLPNGENSGVDILANAVQELLQATRALAEGGLSPLAQQIAQINDKYDDEIKAAKNNTKAIDDLNKARADEIALAIQQAKITAQQNVNKDNQEVAGMTSWMQQMADISDKFAQFAKDKTLPKWEIKQDQDQENQDLGQQAIQSLGLTTENTIDKFKTLTDTLTFLQQNATALGLTATQVAGMFTELGTQMFLSLATELSQYTNNEQEKQQLAQITWDLQVANYKLQIQLLTAAHLLTQDQIDFLNKQISELPSKAPDTSNAAATTSTNNLAAALDSAVQALITFRDSLAQDSSLSPYTPEQKFDLAQTQYESTAALASTGNVAAIQQLSSDAKDYLTAARAYLGAGQGYTDIFNTVLNMLNKIINQYPDAQNSNSNSNSSSGNGDSSGEWIRLASGVLEWFTGSGAMPNGAVPVNLSSNVPPTTPNTGTIIGGAPPGTYPPIGFAPPVVPPENTTPDGATQSNQALLKLAVSSDSANGSVSGMSTALLSLTKGIVGFVGVLHGAHVPGFATGGIVSSSQIVSVAENGPEAIIPLQGGSVPVHILNPNTSSNNNDMLNELKTLTSTLKNGIARLEKATNNQGSIIASAAKASQRTASLITVGRN